jgi:hypothetical protein
MEGETSANAEVARIAPDPKYLDLKGTVRDLSRQVADLLTEQKRTNASL